MLIPEVVGFKLTGKLPEGAPRPTSCSPSPRCCARRASSTSSSSSTARPRRAVARRPRHDRQHGARVRRDHGLLPDRRGDARLPALHRPRRGSRSSWSSATPRSPGLWHDPTAEAALHRHARASTCRRRAVLAGPKRPQDRVPAVDLATAGARTVGAASATSRPGPPTSRRGPTAARPGGRRPSGRRHHRSRQRFELGHGDVVIAAITELHQHLEPGGHAGRRPGRAEGRARASPPSRGSRPAWRPARRSSPSTSAAGRLPDLEALGFHVVGYGCTTCIGNSGPLPTTSLGGHQGRRPGRHLGPVRQPQLRGPRHPVVRANYLASPPLVVAYALAGTMTSTSPPSRSATTPTASRCSCRHLADLGRGQAAVVRSA
jgi:aconitate hydratase